MTAARVHDCGWLANRPCPSCRKELEAMAKLELEPRWSAPARVVIVQTRDAGPREPITGIHLAEISPHAILPENWPWSEGSFELDRRRLRRKADP